jgi:uncharacterized protein YciI
MYCVICKDKPDHVDVRMQNRPDHVSYVLADPSVKTAGPFLADDGETMIGTLLILDVASRADAEAFATNDPYHKAGLFESVEVLPWKHLIGGLADPTA